MHVHSIVKLIKPFVYRRFRCRRRLVCVKSLVIDLCLESMAPRFEFSSANQIFFIFIIFFLMKKNFISLHKYFLHFSNS